MTFESEIRRKMKMPGAGQNGDPWVIEDTRSFSEKMQELHDDVQRRKQDEQTRALRDEVESWGGRRPPDCESVMRRKLHMPFKEDSE